METPDGVREIIELCAVQHGVHVGAMTAKTREESVVAARRAAARILSARGHTTPEIGRYLGGLHHTTIMHLLKTDGPGRRRIKLHLPHMLVGDKLAEDLSTRLQEIATHRKMLQDKLADLADLERRIRLMQETLNPTERVA